MPAEDVAEGAEQVRLKTAVPGECQVPVDVRPWDGPQWSELGEGVHGGAGPVRDLGPAKLPPVGSPRGLVGGMEETDVSREPGRYERKDALAEADQPVTDPLSSVGTVVRPKVLVIIHHAILRSPATLSGSGVVPLSPDTCRPGR